MFIVEGEVGKQPKDGFGVHTTQSSPESGPKTSPKLKSHDLSNLQTFVGALWELTVSLLASCLV